MLNRHREPDGSGQSLLAWMDEPSADRGIAFAASGGWNRISYAELAGRVERTIGGLVERGVGPGDVVTIVSSTSPDFVELFLATIACGATASPVAAPAAFLAGSYKDHLTAIVSAATPKAIVAGAEDLADVEAAMPAAFSQRGTTLISADDLQRSPNARPPRQVSDLPLVQYTSGSSGAPKGVRIGWDQLEANLAATLKWMGWTSADIAVSWLPLYHDFGLIGALVTSLALNSELLIMTPQQFIRSPHRWLECFSREGASIAATTCFGLAYVLRRCRPEELEGMDFSGVTQIAIGAERIDARILHHFYHRLAPFGLRAGAIGPAYGLAEATLGVSGTPSGVAPEIVDVDFTRMVEGAAAPVVGRYDLCSPTPPLPRAVVSCGPPVSGVEVEVRGPAGEVLPTGHVGEIVVRGANVARGYHDVVSDPHFADERLFTGDTGFVHEGNLFVLGRSGDGMKVLGKMVFAEDMELLVAGLPNVSRRTAVLLGVNAGVETVVVLTESSRDDWFDAAVDCIRPEVGGAAIVIVVGPAGTILWTTSGKPKRRAMWKRFEEGTLGRVAFAAPRQR
jgi:acyl-CoA synthetase (AMP-forming)/AMP-acid ligase II